MRTKLTPKEVRSLVMDGGEAWLVLADLAHERGNAGLADLAQKSHEGIFCGDVQGDPYVWRWVHCRRIWGDDSPVTVAIMSLDSEVAISIASRAARRTLERELSKGREPDDRLWKALEAVDSGVRGPEIFNYYLDASRCLESVAQGMRHLIATDDWDLARPVVDSCYAVKNLMAAARTEPHAAFSSSLSMSSSGANAINNDQNELTLQLADIFEVWWDSVCAQR